MRLRSKRPRKGARGQARYWVVATTSLGLLVAFSSGKSHAITLARANFDEERIVQTQQRTSSISHLEISKVVLIAFQKHFRRKLLFQTMQ